MPAPGQGRVSTLLIGVCPGLPLCEAVHTYLFVDGLDLITRSDARAVGAPPGLLLRPGGPLWPTDQARTVNVATLERGGGGVPGVEVRIQLRRGRSVVWSGLGCPGADGGVIEEVRFDLRQYAAELERGYARWGAGKRGAEPRPADGGDQGVTGGDGGDVR
ncbi:hypothetical protein [Kitasatospora sp. NPDC057198]|uniref:hypothetical protein n=1 Tax=Kitasatospora sp. NPDC057198 TaxID=3346046 RepID=UPI003628F6FC